jgi:hypothetical protein
MVGSFMILLRAAWIGHALFWLAVAIFWGVVLIAMAVPLWLIWAYIWVKVRLVEMLRKSAHAWKKPGSMTT